MDRKELNKNQTKLRDELLKFENIELIKQMFLKHHAHLHSLKVYKNSSWSYADEILDGVSEAKIRFIPQKLNHSIAWCFWHLARIEDVTMNTLVENEEQILTSDNYLKKLNVKFTDTGNGMTPEEVAELSKAINIDELINYRTAVGKKTERIVKKLTLKKLKEKISQTSIDRLFKEKALRKNAKGIAEYWSKKTVAGLLLMPATRHNILHLNEANNLLKKRK